jgi:hypothetical protein
MSKVIDQPASPATNSANENSPLELSSGQLFSKDFVFTLLHNKLGSTLTVILNVLMAGMVFFFDTALQYKTQNVAHSISPLLEVLTALRKILTISLGLSVYFLLPRWIANLFNSLRKNMVIANTRKENFHYEDLLNKAIRIIDRKLWAVCGLIFVILFWIYRAFSYYRDFSYSGKRPVWLEAVALIIYALTYYAFLVTLLKFCLVLFLTTRLFGLFDIQVKPLHPDGAGGLGSIGRILSRFVRATVAFALLASAGRLLSYGRYGELHLGRSELLMLLMASTLLPLFLWGWLWVPHKAMIQYRDSKLMILAKEFLRAVPDNYPSTPIDTVTIKENTDRLAELKKSYELLKETYPTWPMSFRRVKSLIALASTPFITTFLPPFIDYLRGR